MKTIASATGRRFRFGGMMILAFALALPLVGCQPQEEVAEEAVEVALNVRTLALAPTEVVEYFEVTGPVEPVTGTVVHCEEMGKVVRIVHDKGAEVPAGGVLLEICQPGSENADEVTR